LCHRMFRRIFLDFSAIYPRYSSPSPLVSILGLLVSRRWFSSIFPLSSQSFFKSLRYILVCVFGLAGPSIVFPRFLRPFPSLFLFSLRYFPVLTSQFHFSKEIRENVKKSYEETVKTRGKKVEETPKRILPNAFTTRIIFPSKILSLNKIIH
jgi:hypothetical protein